MSLKYHIFLVKISSKELKEKLICIDGVIDESIYLHKERKERIKKTDLFIQYMNNKSSNHSEETIVDFFEYSDDIIKYRERTDNKLQIYLVSCPNNIEWSFFTLYNVSTFKNENIYTNMLSFYLNHIFHYFTSDIYSIRYHGGTNDGYICKYEKKTDHIDIINFKHNELENEQFDMYAKRWQHVLQVPFLDFHNWICNENIVNYNYHLTFNKKKENE